MKKMLSKRISLKDKLYVSQFTRAVCMYFFITLYLYAPYLRDFSKIELLYFINSASAATGCFLISRKYTKSLAASILAGTIYAFNPFTLAFTAYHPIASIAPAIIPWLLIPATFLPTPKRISPFSITIRTALYAIPLAVVILFFYLPTLPSIGPFFPMPAVNANLQNFTAILFPQTANAHDFPISFYHIPLFAIILAILTSPPRRNIVIMILAAICVTLSFYKPILNTPPIVWILLPVIVCTLLSAKGAEKITSLTKHRSLISITFYTACCIDILWGAKQALVHIFGNNF
jgi:hypothetical protein